MKRLAWLLLLPLASGALFAQGNYSIYPQTLPGGTVGIQYQTTTMSVYPPLAGTIWSWSGSLPTGLNLAANGILSGTPTTAGSFSFTVQASVSTPASGIQVIATQGYTVVIAAGQVSQVYISPSSLPSVTYGSQYVQELTASGGYGPGTYTFSLDPASPGPLPPGLVISTTGPTTGSISGRPTQAGTFVFTVRATSQIVGGGSVYGTQTYSIAVTGSPLTIATTSLAGGTVGVLYSQNLAATGGSPPYTWQLTGGSLPGGLGLDPPSGNIYGTPGAAGSFTFQVTVRDSQQASATGSFTIRISAGALVITTSSLPAGIAGTPYTPTTLAATGGIPPYTWTASGFPSGLSISSAGVISGTPTVSGNFSVTVQATDSAQVTATKTYSVTVAPATALSITTQAPLAAGEVGVAYTQAFAATGGTPPYTWSASGLPSGLSVSSAGVISGTPTASGSFSVTVKVTDSAQATATQTFTITVTAALTITTATLPNGTVGTAYTATTLAATGGTPPYTWSASGLPSGLSISSAGVISGTPAASGSFSVTVKVTDPAQATATQTFTITVTAALTITTATLPNGTVGTAYTATTLAATGGTPPYTWSASGLPSGLSVSSAGVISGTPIASGSFSVTVQATDAAKATATKSFSITVVGVLTITTATLPNGTVGTAYTATTLAATGGTPPYTWSASGLPSGLSISSAGVITGTPTAAGSFSVTVKVTDSAQATATQTFTITIAAGLTITTATLPNGTVGTAYTATTVAATGGTPPYTWSASGLPSGLSMSSAGVISGTPAVAGSFSVTAKVTDSAQATATQAFTITVAAALTITTATLPNGTVGTAYSQTLTAAGGSGTLTWSITAGALPGGITLNSSAGSLSGTPSAPGTFNFTVGVTGLGQSASQAFTITVGVPPGPPATITGLPATATPATQPALGITIPNSYPLDISGQVTLAFAPDSPSPDGQEVVFTTGGRTVSFTVPANSTQAVFTGATPGVQTGTVSGTITLTLKLTAAGIDVTPSPAPSTRLTIAKSAPVIKSATVTRTTGGFSLVVVGYATSREMVTATVGFTAAAGVTLSSSSASVSLATVFTSWYQSTPSAAYGSNFLLTIPFTFSGSTVPLTSVSVQLTNLQGNSTTANATY